MPRVLVSFEPTPKPRFNFVPDSVTMRGPGTIVLDQDPADPAAKWLFQDAFVKDDTTGQFSSELHDQKKSLHIRDEFHDKEKKSHSYRITVTQDGSTFTSPDPVIVNDPGR